MNQTTTEATTGNTRQGHGFVNDVLNVCKGGLMGAADIIPGVSGGTIALVVGVYSRLVTAISRVDGDLLSLVARGKWSEAARHIDLRFLVGLAGGIGLGAILLGSIIEQLLVGSMSRQVTLSVFLGMILASTVIVARLIHAPNVQEKLVCTVLGLCAALFAFALTGMGTLGSATSLPYVFFCGLIGICAMILPGISGAYLLIVLGFYPQLTDILHRLKDLEIQVTDLVTVGVFATGCLVGIIAFSKCLRWLLSNHVSRTMAVLTGFMLGALRKIWPFQIDLTPDEPKLKHKMFQWTMPEFDQTFWTCLLAAVVAFAVVIVVDRLTRTDPTRI